MRRIDEDRAHATPRRGGRGDRPRAGARRRPGAAHGDRAPSGPPPPRRPAGGPPGGRRRRRGPLARPRPARRPRRLVQARGRLVEEQDRRPADQRPRHADPPPLAAGQAAPPLAQDAVRRQVAQPHAHERRPDLVVGRGGRRQANVLGHGTGEQVRDLRDPGHPCPPGVGIEVAHVGLGPVGGHARPPAPRRLQQPQDHRQQRALAGARRARDAPRSRPAAPPARHRRGRRGPGPAGPRTRPSTTSGRDDLRRPSAARRPARRRRVDDLERARRPR